MHTFQQPAENSDIYRRKKTSWFEKSEIHYKLQAMKYYTLKVKVESLLR